MGRPKLKTKEKKVKLGITISREINYLLENITSNKSKFIENILSECLKNTTVEHSFHANWHKDISGNFVYNGYNEEKKITTKH